MANAKNQRLKFLLLFLCSLFCFSCNDQSFFGSGESKKSVGFRGTSGTPANESPPSRDSGDSDPDDKENDSISNEEEISTDDDLENEDIVIDKAKRVDGLSNSKLKREVVFLIDGSESTEPIRTQLSENMQKFIIEIQEELDVNIHLVGTWALENQNLPNSVKKYRYNIESRELLEAAIDVIENNRLELRKDVLVDLIAVTEDNDKMKAKEFVDFLEDQESKIHFHGIIGYESSQCGIASPGYAYREVDRKSPTSGIMIDICSTHWQGILSKISRLIKKLSKNDYYKLSQKPESVEEIEIILDGKKLNKKDWEYDSELRAIRIDPKLTGTDLKIKYVKK